MKKRLIHILLVGVFTPLLTVASPSGLSGKSIDLKTVDMPGRNPPIEIGEPMLAPGPISKGQVTSKGQVINPGLQIFGNGRVALQQFRAGSDQHITELAGQLNLFANLQFSGFERILLGVQPLNRAGRFTRIQFHPNKDQGFQSELNPTITTLFFEGDLSEMDPARHKTNQHGGDIGFSIGRQLLNFHEGLLINDTVDAVGITQNSLSWQGVSNALVTFYLALHNIDRHSGIRDKHAKFLGVHTRVDTDKATIDMDMIYLHGTRQRYPNAGSDLLDAAVTVIGRTGYWARSLHILGSLATRRKTIDANNGLLVLLENNREVGEHHNIVYWNVAGTLGEFTSIARDPTAGGPLGRLGILFGSPQLGMLGSAMSNRARKVVAMTVGYQQFIDSRWQGLVELGGRFSAQDEDSLGVGFRLQRGLSDRAVWRNDVFIAARRGLPVAYGLRTEYLVKI